MKNSLLYLLALVSTTISYACEPCKKFEPMVRNGRYSEWRRYEGGVRFFHICEELVCAGLEGPAFGQCYTKCIEPHILANQKLLATQKLIEEAKHDSKEKENDNSK